MAEHPYSLSPVEGYTQYKVTGAMKDYLTTLMESPENNEEISQILKLINDYVAQLRSLRAINRFDTTKEVYKAIERFFDSAPDENKKGIQCKSGCTFCCHIELDVSGDEAALIIDYCRENNIEIDREYLIKQAAAGRKTFSELSGCVFLKDGLCAIYPVRPIACRKHWVRSEPAHCDSSKNITNKVDKYFNLNTEILASAVLNVESSESLEMALLNEIDKRS